jgi:RNA polymerase sigma-70 factor (ECF subfamily)
MDSDGVDANSAFMAHYLEVQPALYSYLVALVAHDADDVLQEVSIALMTSYARYDASRPFIGWALGIARNHVARWRRGRATARRFGPVAEESLAVAYEDLESELGEERRALRDCVSRLGPEARELLRLRYEAHLPLAELARVQATTLGAVSKSLGRIRRVLSLCTERASAGPARS